MASGICRPGSAGAPSRRWWRPGRAGRRAGQAGCGRRRRTAAARRGDRGAKNSASLVENRGNPHGRGRNGATGRLRGRYPASAPPRSGARSSAAAKRSDTRERRRRTDRAALSARPAGKTGTDGPVGARICPDPPMRISQPRRWPPPVIGQALFASSVRSSPLPGLPRLRTIRLMTGGGHGSPLSALPKARLSPRQTPIRPRRDRPGWIT